MTELQYETIDRIKKLDETQTKIVFYFVNQFDYKKEIDTNKKSAAGMLKKYADVSKWPNEEKAYSNAIVEKYEKINLL